MKTCSSPFAGVFRRPFLAGLIALSCALLAPALRAQAQYAGTYVGTMNLKVTVPVIGSVTESSFGFYSATVSSTGAFSLNSGALTGTVSAAGAVTINGGSSFDLFALTSATISGTTLSSNYGAFSAASNNTTQYKINGSTSFTAAAGGGSGGGGSGGTAVAWQNGSFEGGPNPGGSWITLASGSTVINGWTVTSGSIDYMGTAWPASAGTRSIDLSGNSAGAIAQTFITTAGTSYTVTFDFAGNPGYGNGTGVKSMRVSVNNTNATNTTYTFDTTGKTLSNLGWTVKTFTFTASAASTTLTFTSQDTSSYGPVIDNVLLNGVSGSTGSAAAVGTTTVTGTTATVAPGNLTSYRNKVGTTYEFSITGSTSGAVWGTDVYTDDSSVAAAAVHAGVVRVGETKVVAVSILAGQGSYSASSRNGISSSSWGAWSGSYSFGGGTGSTGTAVSVPVLAVSAASINIARSIAYGSSIVLTVPITGVGPFTYQWFLNGTAIQGATTASYSIASVTAANAGTYSMRVTNSAGSSTIAAGSVAVSGSTAGVPSFTLQPFNKIVSPGGTFALAASATGSGISYQWFRNNVALSGETGSIILRNSANAGDAGSYTVRVTNSAGSLTSTPAVVTLDPNASVIANISVRVAATAGQIITPGFTISGTGKKRLLIRAVGPGLVPFGISAADAMADPKLTVFEGSTAIAGLNNNDWDASIASAFTAVGAFGLTAGSKDAAIVVELDASATGRGYTVQVTGNNNSAGVVLLEVYDLGNVTGGSKLTNVSVLSRAGTGSSTLILGLVLKGSGQRTLLVRGVGPTLAAAPFNIGGTLADPKLTVVDGNQRSVFSNLDWGQADYLSELVLATNFVGAFALVDQSKDAATLCLLDSGSYTIPVVGQDDGTGTAIVEVYEVP